jgi:hypothetical protein
MPGCVGSVLGDIALVCPRLTVVMSCISSGQADMSCIKGNDPACLIYRHMPKLTKKTWRRSVRNAASKQVTRARKRPSTTSTTFCGGHHCCNIPPGHYTTSLPQVSVTPTSHNPHVLKGATVIFDPTLLKTLLHRTKTSKKHVLPLILPFHSVESGVDAIVYAIMY